MNLPKGIELADMEMTFTDSVVSGRTGVLTVRVKDEGAGKYMEIQTDGWAFDSVEELTTILNQVKEIAEGKQK